MVSGFDKYFQIAPCFRDEDARADRSPGEFYQLDLEMSFVEQEDVFNVVEKLLVKLFKQFSPKRIVNEKFPRIKYQEAMLKYGTDKPDLRNPLIIYEITSLFNREDVKFEIFKKLVKSGSIVRAIITKNTSEKPRSFFDNIDKWAKEQGASGLAYFTLEKDKEIRGKGPVGKFFSEDSLKELMKISNAKIGDSIFLACGKEKEIEKLLSIARDKIANDLEIIEKDQFSFCWIVDYPMYEYDENSKKIIFSHNPFSMPQGNLKDLNFDKCRIKTEVIWEVNGTTISKSFEQLSVNTKNNISLENGAFIFTGSKEIEGAYLADMSGSIVAIYADEEAVINSSDHDSNNDDVWIANGKDMPELELPVIVRFLLPRRD